MAEAVVVRDLFFSCVVLQSVTTMCMHASGPVPFLSVRGQPAYFHGLNSLRGYPDMCNLLDGLVALGCIML